MVLTDLIVACTIAISLARGQADFSWKEGRIRWGAGGAGNRLLRLDPDHWGTQPRRRGFTQRVDTSSFIASRISDILP